MLARITAVSSALAAPYPAVPTCRVYSGSVKTAIAFAAMSAAW